VSRVAIRALIAPFIGVDEVRPMLLTIREAAGVLRIGRSTLYELVGRGDIEVVHIGRAVRVPVDALHAFVEACRTPRVS
jgi:excisionase family DNA binding protein